MKRLYLVLLCLGAWAQVSTASADLRCKVRNASFVMDETDFNAIKEGKVRNNNVGPVVTKETFDALDQKTRAAICGSRLIARLFKAGKGHSCDFVEQSLTDDWNNIYFSNSEWDGILSGTNGHCGHAVPRETTLMVDTV